jgi:hypothetical protein
MAATTLLFLLAAATVAAAAPVPAIFVLGDSIVDVGNNNHLPTLLRADVPHNGIDYPGRQATGRFSNGKNCADFIGGSLKTVAWCPIWHHFCISLSRVK